MLANAAAKKESFLKDYTKMEEIKRKFLRTKQPTEDEIISVLMSQDRRFQRIGLVAMFLKPIETDQLTDILLGFLQDQDREFRVYAAYSLEDFTKYSEPENASLGKQLLEIIKNEKDMEVFLRETNLLAKFPSEEAALFLTEQLMKEGKENRFSRYYAFRALKEMGDSFYDKAEEYVKNHGSPEIKEELFDWAKLWEEQHTPAGEGIKDY